MNIKQVKVTEVGPRDGFQSEKTILNTEDKIDIINNLTEENVRLKDDMELLLGFMKLKNLNEEFIVWKNQLRS